MIQDEFAEYLRKLGKSENTIQTYCHDIEQFFRWCRNSFDDEPQQLYRANIPIPLRPKRCGITFARTHWKRGLRDP